MAEEEARKKAASYFEQISRFLEIVTPPRFETPMKITRIDLSSLAAREVLMPSRGGRILGELTYRGPRGEAVYAPAWAPGIGVPTPEAPPVEKAPAWITPGIPAAPPPAYMPPAAPPSYAPPPMVPAPPPAPTPTPTPTLPFFRPEPVVIRPPPPPPNGFPAPPPPIKTGLGVPPVSVIERRMQ